MTVVLANYDENWPRMFDEEKSRLTNVIGSFLQGSVEHVGSTAIIGMVAKPVIDIMFGVRDLESSISAIPILEKNGYCYYPYKADVMHWFCKPTPEIRTHHLHLIPYQSVLWRERIAFRDAVKSDISLFDKYAKLKVRLAKDFHNDRELYTEKKEPFIAGVLANLIY